MDDRTQPMLKTKFRDMIFPDFPDDENTVTTTVTKSRRVSFGTNLVKEFIVGSAVSAQCVSEYEQAFSSSDSSNANSSYSAVESGLLDQNTFVVEEKSKILQPIPPPNGSNIPDNESLDRTLSKRPKFGSTICFSADSPTADMEFTEGCLTLAKSILDKKNKEMTVIIQAKPKEEEKTKDEETKYFDGSQFDMSMTKCFKSKENKREEKRFEDEKTRIFSSQDDDMSMTKCDKLFRMRQMEQDDSDESMEDESKENQIPLDLIMRHLDKDKDNTDFGFLFHPQKSLSDVLNGVSMDLSNDSEKLNLNESMDISRDFQPELLAAKNHPSTEVKTVEREEVSSLSVTKTIEEQVYVSREEIILREERVVLVQKEGESLTGIRTAYESLDEEKEEPEDAEMEITLTGSGNVISNGASEKEERSNDLEVTKDTGANEEVSKTLKDTTEDEMIDKSVVDDKSDEDTNHQESKEMDVETETKEMSLEVAKEQMDVNVSKEEEMEMLTLDTENENQIVTSSQELSFSKQQEESGMEVFKGQISGDVDVTLTEEKETKGSLNLSEGLINNTDTSSVGPEEQKDSSESLVTPEGKRVVEMTEEEDEKEEVEEEKEKEEQNMSDMEMTLAKGKKLKEMTLDEVLKEITKEHEVFDEKVLEKYFEKDPEGDSESFLEKDMEDVEMQLDLEELNDESVNKSEMSSKESPKSAVVPRRESIRLERSKVKPEERKESERVEREPPLADAKVIESLKQQSEERCCVWRLDELRYEEKENVGFMSFNLKLMESSTTIKFRLKANEEEEGLFAWSVISSAEMELNQDGNPKTKDYKTTVMFGYEIQRKYFLEEKKMAKTTQHIPYFLDKMNSFTLKLDGYLNQIHLILSSFPGSRLNGSFLSFRLFSFPLLFSSTVSINLTDLFRLSKSCLSFNTEFGSLNENEMKEIFEKYLNQGGPTLWPTIMAMTKRIIQNEIEETGRVSKRDHIPLLNGVFQC